MTVFLRRRSVGEETRCRRWDGELSVDVAKAEQVIWSVEHDAQLLVERRPAAREAVAESWMTPGTFFWTVKRVDGV